MINTDMAAKPGLETASHLPAHHCHDPNMSLAEQSLHQETAHQVFAIPPNHCQTQIHNLLCTTPPMGILFRVLLANIIQNWFQIHSREISSLRGWEPLNHGHHCVKVQGLSPLWTVKHHSANRTGLLTADTGIAFSPLYVIIDALTFWLQPCVYCGC